MYGALNEPLRICSRPMIETILFIWIGLPIITIPMLYLCLMGFTWPGEMTTSDENSEYRDVYSEDTNRIDENGGPYKVKIEK